MAVCLELALLQNLYPDNLGSSGPVACNNLVSNCSPCRTSKTRYIRTTASNVKLISHYMFHGCVTYARVIVSFAHLIRGTNWGGPPFPGLYQVSNMHTFAKI